MITAFDLETRGLDWHNPEHSAFLATTCLEASIPKVYDLAGADAVAALHYELLAATTIVAHNAAFDVHHLREATGIDLMDDSFAPVHDTEILARLVLPSGQKRRPYGLKALATELLSDDASDLEGAIVEAAKEHKIKLRETGGYYALWKSAPAPLESYAAYDAQLTLELYHLLYPQMIESTRQCWALELETFRHRIALEQRGIALDPEAVARLHRQYTDERHRLHDEITRELGDIPLEGQGSGDALLEGLQGLGVELTKRTPGGKLSTDKWALEPFAEQYSVIRYIQEWRTAGVFLSTFIEPMRGRTEVKPNYRQIGGWTGRMSSASPNLQNVPRQAGKEVRAMFVARPDHKLIVADYEAIEIRLLAHYLGALGAPYRQLIRDGLDPHAWMSAQIWGGETEEYEKGAPKEELRQKGKTLLFAICYGAGKPRVSAVLGCSIEEAAQLIAKVKGTIPGFKALWTRLEKKVASDGFVTTLFGRKQPVSVDNNHIALNALIQGSAADIMKAGFVKAADALADIDGHPLLLVHDELVAEVPALRDLDGVHAVVTGMTGAYNLDPPLEVTVSVVDNYSQA